MNTTTRALGSRILFVSVLLACLGFTLVMPAHTDDPNLRNFADPTGAVRTISTTGSVDTSNPFFQSWGPTDEPASLVISRVTPGR